MKNVFLVLLFLMIFSGGSFASSNDVVRGEQMADQGEIIEKRSFSFAPHAEIEYRAESIDIGKGGSGANYPALAYGLGVKKGSFLLDIYSRIPLQGNDEGDEYIDLDSDSVFGVTLAKTVDERNGTAGYLSLSLEYRDVSIVEDFGFGKDIYGLKTYSLKPGIGFYTSSPKYSNVIGGGLVLFGGEASADYYDTFKGIRIKGEGDTYGIGLFVQNKFVYKLTQSVSIPMSLYWEGSTSIQDPEIANDSTNTISSSYWNLGVRIGVQYVF